MFQGFDLHILDQATKFGHWNPLKIRHDSEITDVKIIHVLPENDTIILIRSKAQIQLCR